MHSPQTQRYVNKNTPENDRPPWSAHGALYSSEYYKSSFHRNKASNPIPRRLGLGRERCPQCCCGECRREGLWPEKRGSTHQLQFQLFPTAGTPGLTLMSKQRLRVKELES